VYGAPGAGPFRWSPFAAGNFIALGGIASFPFLAMNSMLLLHKLSEIMVDENT
jgi:hypothetical protein